MLIFKVFTDSRDKFNSDPFLGSSFRWADRSRPQVQRSLTTSSAQPLSVYPDLGTVNVNSLIPNTPVEPYIPSPYRLRPQAPTYVTAANRLQASNLSAAGVPGPNITGPTSNPRESKPQIETPCPGIPINIWSNEEDHSDKRRFVIQHVDTDTEGVEIVGFFQVSHSHPSKKTTSIY